ILREMGYVHYNKGEHKEAANFYLKAANQGDISAQFNLGWMYANGLGVPEDDVEAFKWFRKAAHQGNASAQFNLGLMCEKGEGVNEDKKEALKWFQKAADNGHVIASQMPGVKKTIEESDISLKEYDNTKQKAAFELSDVDREPRPLVRIPPQFPPKLLMNRVSGRVDLLIVIDEEGRVTDYEVLRFTHDEFTREVIRVIRQWKFSPAIKDGKPVAVTKIQPFYFGKQE
ncbi:MAG: TonB family protein, partial [Verrucomicrobia bacterium]|nr:TonB family protein [Verrucomicrobiota bacterium]